MASINDTTDNDTLQSTSNADINEGRDGNDRVSGGLSNDLVCGDDGTGIRSEADGNSQIGGDNGTDVLPGDSGADAPSVSAGDDTTEPSNPMARMDGTIGGLAFVGTATLPRIRGTAPREEAASDIIGDRPQVVRASDGALVWTDIDAAGVTSEVTITRSCAAVPWSEADIALLTCLGPHLSRALRLHHRFAADTQAAPPATATATRLLSQREQECLGWVARGATSRFAARQLGLSSRTVDKHVQSAIAKLGVTNRTAAAAVAVAHGLINI